MMKCLDLDGQRPLVPEQARRPVAILNSYIKTTTNSREFGGLFEYYFHLLHNKFIYSVFTYSFFL